MSEDWTIHLDLPATHRFMNVLGAVITEMLARVDDPQVEPGAIYQVQLAAHEIGVNIVDHSYAGGPGRIAITLSLTDTPRQFTVELRDDGAYPFDPTKIVVPAAEDLELHGRGILLVCEAMDRVVYQSRQEQCWEVRKGEVWRAIKSEVLAPGQNVWRLIKLV